MIHQYLRWSKKILMDENNSVEHRKLSSSLLAQFLKETAAKPEPEEEIELPSNFVVVDSKKLAKERRKKARDEIEKMVNRKNVRRTTYGCAVAQTKKTPTPSVTFNSKKTKIKKEEKDDDE